MEKVEVLAALSALAQETRLDVFRRLVQAGTRGLPAGELATVLEIAPATLSFHLKELRNAGLVTSQRHGRSIRYAPAFAVIAGVVRYLGENCCEDDARAETGSCTAPRAPAMAGSVTAPCSGSQAAERSDSECS